MLIMSVIFAHAHGAPHLHPHGFGVAGVLAAAGILVLLGLGIRAMRDDADRP